MCFIPFIALKRNILENSDFVLLKEDIHRFISSIELFLRDIRGLRYADLKKVNFFAGHPVDSREISWHERSALQSVAVQAVDWQRR